MVWKGKEISLSTAAYQRKTQERFEIVAIAVVFCAETDFSLIISYTEGE